MYVNLTSFEIVKYWVAQRRPTVFFSRAPGHSGPALLKWISAHCGATRQLVLEQVAWRQSIVLIQLQFLKDRPRTGRFYLFWRYSQCPFNCWETALCWMIKNVLIKRAQQNELISFWLSVTIHFFIDNLTDFLQWKGLCPLTFQSISIFQ